MITILTSSNVATKTWLADGSILGFDAGYGYQVSQAPVAGLTELSNLLTIIQHNPQLMVIRGMYRGDAHARTVRHLTKRTGLLEPGLTSDGLARRILENFDDQPLPWMMIDIDDYAPPAGIDPIAEPERAIQAYIGANLPPCFYGAGYHWQLSSGAGHARNAGLLKAHVWFWLSTPMTSLQLYAWRRGHDPDGNKIDGSVFNAVQPHYTALPVFAPGVADPVPRRCGLSAGGPVALTIDPATAAAASRDNDGRYDVTDPREKPGAIGAFCRAYTIEQLIETTLAGHFEFEGGSEWRLTWLRGGGSEGGAFITEDRLHVVSKHATDPCRNRKTNLFDLVRIHCFGAADAGADFLQLKQMRTTPSYQHMLDWTMRLEPAVAEMRVKPTPAVHAAVGVTAAAVAITDETLLFPPAQMAYFFGCVYVTALHRILVPGGDLLDQQRFNATYGGRSFVMDPTNARTVRSAWECFLESQAIEFPKVHGCLFRPELQEGTVATLEGRQYVNMYSPIETRQIEGDPGPFLRLMEKMLPDARDRDILLTYMASMLRNPGVKFQWWPVLQGAEGNGKTAFIRLLQHCVGKRYSQLPNTGELAKNGIKFNAWIIACLFLGFEEVYVPGRRAFLEEMKPIVTNDSLQVERKGVDHTMEDNRANGLMCTNHPDGVPVTTDTRRYAIFYTAQQPITGAEDKKRAGMTGEYFMDFYNWCYGRGAYAAGGENYGFAIMNWWLRTQYVLKDEFDPAGSCQVAPKTSSSSAAIIASMGPIEQEILEAIDSELQGFRGGWISGAALDRLLDKTKKSIPRNQRRGILRSLGFDWHPHLREGRTTHGTILDGPGKFNLYAKRDSVITQISVAKEIIEKYLADQQ
jgi:hypothetical protein